MLDVGEAFRLGDAVLLPTRIRLGKPKIRPRSATRDFWTDWGTMKPDPGAIVRAVEVLRKQTRNASEKAGSNSSQG